MMMYYRPIPMQGVARPANARQIAGGWCWFDRVEKITRGGRRELIAIEEVPAEVLAQITTPRTDIAGLSFDTPRIMGILNVTPDSFSDGGDFSAPEAAMKHARDMVIDGADILDIGGESTRPGADVVPIDLEISRTAPVISAIRSEMQTPISIDSRNARAAQAAISAGADLINDVSALSHDAEMVKLAVDTASPVCLMHARGVPKTMQSSPRYKDVLLDVYDHLQTRIMVVEAAGIPRSRIMIDPGIGFGKRSEHNLVLLRDISLFHSLGCVILLGASRKKFIGDITGTQSAKDRTFGSVAVAILAVTQGVQMMRVHDIKSTKQAISMQMAIIMTKQD
ncbi:dihydropteroate synthase [Profundibacter sp.]